MRKALIFVAALICSAPCHAQGIEQRVTLPWRTGTTYAGDTPLVRAAIGVTTQQPAEFQNILVPRRARVPGRTCKKRIVNGIVIGAALGAIVGVATGGGAARATGGAMRLGPLGGFVGVKSCRW